MTTHTFQYLMKASNRTITTGFQQICRGHFMYTCVPSPDEHATLAKNCIQVEQLHRHSKCAVGAEIIMNAKTKWKLSNTCFINSTIILGVQISFRSF